MRLTPALVAALLLASAAGASSSVAETAAPSAKRPKPLVMRDSCVRGSLRNGIVRFTAADRVRLIGVRLGSGPRGVVLAHMSGQNLCAWLPDARRLAAAGYHVLAFDMRQHGSSSTPAAYRKWNRFDLDVRAAVATLRRRGARTVVTAGGSLGAIAVVAAGPTTRPPVDGIVSLSPPVAAGPLSGERAAPRINSPTLYAAAEDDRSFADAARRLYELTAASDKRLLIFPGGAHGIGLLHGPDGERMWAEFAEFLERRSAPVS